MLVRHYMWILVEMGLMRMSERFLDLWAWTPEASEGVDEDGCGVCRRPERGLMPEMGKAILTSENPPQSVENRRRPKESSSQLLQIISK